MMRLAKYYQADRLLLHCERHLRMSREMPADERMTLAKKYGSQNVQVQKNNCFYFYTFSTHFCTMSLHRMKLAVCAA